MDRAESAEWLEGNLIVEAIRVNANIQSQATSALANAITRSEGRMGEVQDMIRDFPRRALPPLTQMPPHQEGLSHRMKNNPAHSILRQSNSNVNKDFSQMSRWEPTRRIRNPWETKVENGEQAPDENPVINLVEEDHEDLVLQDIIQPSSPRPTDVASQQVTTSDDQPSQASWSFRGGHSKLKPLRCKGKMLLLFSSHQHDGD